jgi:hypothetical protein
LLLYNLIETLSFAAVLCHGVFTPWQPVEIMGVQAYLDEFSFRFNRRLSEHRGMLFYRLIQQAVTARPPAVKALYVSKPQPVAGT